MQPLMSSDDTIQVSPNCIPQLEKFESTLRKVSGYLKEGAKEWWKQWVADTRKDQQAVQEGMHVFWSKLYFCQLESMHI